MKIAPSNRVVRLLFTTLVVVWGGFHAWIGRYYLNPDGVCYLDLGDAFANRRWSEAVNAYWSPLYAWILGSALHPLGRSPRWELPVAHLVNFGIYLFAFGSFELFLRSILKLRETSATVADSTVALPEWALHAVGYSLFLWSSLDLITLEKITPDLLVAGFVYLIAALLVRIQAGAGKVAFVAFGVLLGLAYWAKAVMFPLGLALLVIAGLAIPARRNRLSRIAIAAVTFVAVSAPLVLALTHKEGRFTFGDSGRLSYASLVSPGGGVRNWQGQPPASGLPIHPTRRMLERPAAYEFAQPIAGTYPPSYDPAYWNAGRRWTFDLRAQATVVVRHLMMYLELFLRAQAGLLAVCAAFLVRGGKGACRRTLNYWPLLVLAGCTFGVYMLVFAEVRYLGAQIVIAWMAVLIGIRLPRPIGEDRLCAACMAAVAATILCSVLSNSAHAWRDGSLNSAASHIEAAEELDELGLHPGNQVAVIGDGNWAYWAHFERVRIIAEIMDSDASGFWCLSSPEREPVYRAMQKVGASALVAEPPLPSVTLEEGWARVGATPYYIRWLQPHGDGVLARRGP